MATRIIGDSDTVLGYRFAGISGDVVENRDQALEAFRKAISDTSPGLLLITESVEDMIPEEVLSHRIAATSPYLSVVPGMTPSLKKRKSLQEVITEAVGIKIVKSDH